MHGDLFNTESEFTLTAPATDPSTTNDAEAEAVAALVALGYKPQEASKMVSKITKTGRIVKP